MPTRKSVLFLYAVWPNNAGLSVFGVKMTWSKFCEKPRFSVVFFWLKSKA